MKLEKICLNKRLFLIFPFILVSCTIIPQKIKLNNPSFDSRGQLTSNFSGFYTNNLNNVYGVIDQDGEKRYENLVSKYGKNSLINLKNHIFSPPDGISSFTNNTYLINLDCLRKFETMNRWNKSNIK